MIRRILAPTLSYLPMSHALAAWAPCVVLGLSLSLVGSAPGRLMAEELKAPSPPLSCCPHGKRTGDQVWLVSTRHLGCDGTSADLPRFRVQYFAQGAWHAADAETLLAFDDPERPTVIFIHGNRYTASEAVQSGWEAYHALLRCHPSGQPLRFVIWSWPSDQMGGPIKDVRIKVSRTLIEGYYLAQLTTRFRPGTPIGIIGYSFGSRVALGAVHLAAGGQLAGRVVPAAPESFTTYRIAMLAAGVEDHGLMPGARFQMALSRTEHLLNLYNSRDPALKRYAVVEKGSKPTAMGYSGIAGKYVLGPDALRITECNVSGIVGKTHNEDPYFASEFVMQRVRATVLTPGVPVSPTPQVATK